MNTAIRLSTCAMRRLQVVNKPNLLIKPYKISSYVKLNQYRNFSSNNSENNDTTTNTSNNSANDAADNASNEDIPEETIKSSEENTIERLNKEIKSLKDQVLRSLAEEENVRRIARKDVDNARAYANTSFAKAMLEIADNLERALAVDVNNYPPEKSLQLVVEGISMTEKNLQKAFHKFGVVKYGSVGDVFDPSIHEVLFQLPDPSKPAGTIGQVLKTGYKLNDRVIRAAEVGTIVHP